MAPPSVNAILSLPDAELAQLLKEYIGELDRRIKQYDNQLISNAIALDILSHVAVDLGYIECTYCHKKGKKR